MPVSLLLCPVKWELQFCIEGYLKDNKAHVVILSEDWGPWTDRRSRRWAEDQVKTHNKHRKTRYTPGARKAIKKEVPETEIRPGPDTDNGNPTGRTKQPLMGAEVVRENKPKSRPKLAGSNARKIQKLRVKKITTRAKSLWSNCPPPPETQTWSSSRKEGIGLGIRPGFKQEPWSQMPLGNELQKAHEGPPSQNSLYNPSSLPVHYASASMVLNLLQFTFCFLPTILPYMGLDIEFEWFHLWWTQKPH